MTASFSPSEQMKFLNAYTPPSPPPPVPPNVNLKTPPEEYDLNFNGGAVFPLRTDKVALIPFVPSLHAEGYYERIAGDDDLMKYMPYFPRPSESLSNVCEAIDTSIRKLPGSLLFAIYDLTKASPEDLTAAEHPPVSCMAGVIGLLNVDRVHLVGEIGHVVILPPFQRTHVATHANALLLHYCLDLGVMRVWSSEYQAFVAPQASDPRERPLGLRRLQWQAHHGNLPSQKASQRLGFRAEGIARCQRILKTPDGDEAGRPGDGSEFGSRSSWIGAMTWRDWEEGGVRENIDVLVAR